MRHRNRPPWMVEVPILQEQKIGRPPWMVEVPILQEQKIGRPRQRRECK
ncbi:hypothetical protein [Candidatus Spongiihabitans sp.]